MTCAWKKASTLSAYVANIPWIKQALTFCIQVIDGLPIVSTEQKPKLIKFLLKKLNTAGKTTEDAIFMPMNDKEMSEG